MFVIETQNLGKAQAFGALPAVAAPLHLKGSELKIKISEENDVGQERPWISL